jgi:alanine racemase
VAIHVKVDTGMGRIGVRYNSVREFAHALRDLDHLRLEGVMTHFASADDLSQNEFTDLQIRRFNDSVEIFRELGFRPSYLDLANSPGAVAHPNSRGNLVRLGGVLYGLGGDVLPGGIEKPELRAVMSLHTKIAHLKTLPAGETIGYGRTFTTESETAIATIPIGYDDGYMRSLSNVGRAIVRGKYAPVAGRVSMDWTTLDVSAIEGVSVGDEVILIGKKDGLSINAEEIAAAAGTISYEVTCSIDRRVPRLYLPLADEM